MQSRNGVRPLVWVDTAKAVCVCLVVLMHGEAQIAVAGWAQPARLMDSWHALNAFLQPLRIPTFFTISGILASKGLMQPRPGSFRKGFMRPLYLYLVWAAIFAVLIPHYPNLGSSGMTLRDRVLEIVLLGSPAWYLYGLGLYYLTTKATIGLPTGPVLLSCAALSIAGSIVAPDEQVYAAKLCHCLFFFVAGARLKGPLVGFAQSATARRGGALLALYIAGSLASIPIGLHLLPLDIVAVAFSLTAFSLASRRLGALARPIAWIGHNTLLVYVLHFPLILLLSGAIRNWAGPGLLLDPWLGLAYPVVATAFVVPASLALGVMMKGLGLHMLFDLPRQKDLPSAAEPARLDDDGSLPSTP